MMTLTLRCAFRHGVCLTTTATDVGIPVHNRSIHIVSLRPNINLRVLFSYGSARMGWRKAGEVFENLSGLSRLMDGIYDMMCIRKASGFPGWRAALRKPRAGNLSMPFNYSVAARAFLMAA